MTKRQEYNFSTHWERTKKHTYYQGLFMLFGVVFVQLSKYLNSLTELS